MIQIQKTKTGGCKIYLSKSLEQKIKEANNLNEFNHIGIYQYFEEKTGELKFALAHDGESSLYPRLQTDTRKYLRFFTSKTSFEFIKAWLSTNKRKFAVPIGEVIQIGENNDSFLFPLKRQAI